MGVGGEEPTQGMLMSRLPLWAQFHWDIRETA